MEGVPPAANLVARHGDLRSRKCPNGKIWRSALSQVGSHEAITIGSHLAAGAYPCHPSAADDIAGQCGPRALENHHDRRQPAFPGQFVSAQTNGPSGVDADGNLGIVDNAIVQHGRVAGLSFGKSDPCGLVVMAVISNQNADDATLLTDPGLFVMMAFVADDDGTGAGARADAGQFVPVTAIFLDDWGGLFPCADAGHFIFVTVVVLDHRPGFTTGANSDSGPAVVVALVPPHDRLRTLADTDSGADVSMAHIIDNQGAGARVPDSGVEILKTSIGPDGRR